MRHIHRDRDEEMREREKVISFSSSCLSVSQAPRGDITSSPP